jgi:hypothetical protein
MNPLLDTIRRAEEIVAQVQQASTELEEAIASERTWQGHYKEALATYEMAEIETLSEAIIGAKAGDGPLAGIAVSGKGYDLVLTNLKNQLRKGKLAQQWQAAETVRRNYDNAQIDLVQCETRFKATCRVAELMNNILRASTI